MMDCNQIVAERLQLPLHCCRRLSLDRVVCIVTEDWLKQLYQGRVQTLIQGSSISSPVAEKYLAGSCSSLPRPWTRITVKVWPKSDQEGLGVWDSSLSSTRMGDSLLELLSFIARENLQNLWQSIQQKYPHAHLPHHATQHPHHISAQSSRNQESADAMCHLIWRLSPNVYIRLQDDGGGHKSGDNVRNVNPRVNSQDANVDKSSQNILPVRVILETDDLFLLVQPYLEFTLHNIVSYSPAVLETCYAKSLFILYQILQSITALHACGMPAGCISMNTVLLDSDLWVNLVSPQKQALIGTQILAHSTQENQNVENARDVSVDATGSKLEGSKISGPQSKTLKQPTVTITSSVSSKTTVAAISAHSYLSRQPSKGFTDEDERMYADACQFLHQQRYKDYDQCTIDETVEAWVHRRLSNFQYLMILNHLAGRSMNDPNNHPVLPWVMDFSSSQDGYRDLSRSKFRLNKGDSQLDFTYGQQSSLTNLSSSSNDLDHVPHHVSDVLSDITYYVYKARRMPKSILCTHVRSNWVPHEYPASMQRMQHWTPDECIPEFFTDPSLFQSIHSDLPDLEIPPWCSSTYEFVVRHMAALESEKVSENLHHWIDLTFGYKLTGKAAIMAKNVYLQLVDGHQTLRSHGVMQLFTQPHPYRLPVSHKKQFSLPRVVRHLLPNQLVPIGKASNDYKQQDSLMIDSSMDIIATDSSRPEKATIHLPLNYDPLLELENCEALLGFQSKALLLNLKEENIPSNQMESKSQQSMLVLNDVISFLCLVCEIYLAPMLRMQETTPPLIKRVKKLKTILATDLFMIPRPFQLAAKLVLDIIIEDDDCNKDQHTCKIHFSPVVLDGLPPPTPALLLHPLSGIIPFPAYFPGLHQCMSTLKMTDEKMEEIKRGMHSMAEKAALLKQLARSKVPLLEQFLLKYADNLGQEGLQLVMPLIESLLSDKLTTVQAAWGLFNIVAKALGPAETSHRFLQPLIALFTECPASAKHVKLYHRTFLTQLLLRLHLQPFLHHFATLLVEAVAGYKDYVLPSSSFYQEELLEEFDDAKQEENEWSVDVQDLNAENVSEMDTVDGAATVLLEDEEKGENLPDRAADVGEEFIDTMSLVDDSNGATVLPEGSFARSVSQIFFISEGEDEIVSEDGILEQLSDSGDPERCSIHSISNILCMNATVRSKMGMEEDDKVFLANRDKMDKPTFRLASGSSLSSASSLGTASPVKQLEGGDRFRSRTLDPKDLKVLTEPEQQKGMTYFTSDNVRVVQDGGDITKGRRSDTKSFITDTQQKSSTFSRVQSLKTLPASAADRGSKSSDKGIDEIDAGQDGIHFTVSEDDPANTPGRNKSDSIKRSETEDLMSSFSLNSPNSVVNIRHIATDSVKWLSHKLGPVLTARYLSKNLVRMLPLCYLGESQMQLCDAPDESVLKTSRRLIGDSSASKVLECIGFIASLYGENIIAIQYLPNIIDMISVAQRRLTQRSESGLIGAVVLLRFLIPLLSEKALMDAMDTLIVNDCINPLLSMLTSTTVSFAGGALSRSLLCHKLVDLMYVLGLRLGLELTRQYLHRPMLVLMEAFTVVHGPEDGSCALSSSPVCGSANSEESYLNIKMDSVTHQYTIGSPVNPAALNSTTPGSMSGPSGSSTSRWHSLNAFSTLDDRDECLSPRPETAEKCHQELAAVFTPELALSVYIPLCRIFGSIHMEESLKNDDLIRQLCAQQDSTIDQPQMSSNCVSSVKEDDLTPTSPEAGGIGSNVKIRGNRIQFADVPSTDPTPSHTQFGRGYRHDGILYITQDELRSNEMELHKTRHLQGNWLQYWEHEIGLRERDTVFNFKQIKLQTFTGHSNSIRSIMVMDTENCFISASKDKTVRLWGLSSCGDGHSRLPCQWTYTKHKKSVFSVAYVESMRQVASCDSTVHVWDPYTGVSLCQLESPRYIPSVALHAIPAPSSLVLMGTTEATLRFLDLRTHDYTHEFKSSIGSTGLLRCMTVSPEGSWVAVGYSTGVISILELSSGLLLSTWKAHDGEILQIKAFSKQKLVSSSFDGTLRVWNVEGGVEICTLKGPSDPVHCFNFYREQVLSATTANRIGVHSSVGENAIFTTTKLRSDTFKGVLTTMSVLPLNKTLLLGSDSGVIHLLA